MTRKNNNIILAVCIKCKNGFVIGSGGIYTRDTDDDLYDTICDACAGVERDAAGNAWLPGETEITWEDGTVTTRAEAFPK